MGLFDFLKKDNSAHPIFEALGTDMHCHLVPRVDDGSKSIEETLSCLKMLYEVGYKKVYITPHFQTPRFPNKEEDIIRRYEEVKAAAADLKIELLGIGGEYRLDPEFVQTMDNRELLTIGSEDSWDKGYLLVEFPMHQGVPRAEEIIASLQSKGYNVILAHPERYPYINVGSTLFEDLKDMGVLFQVNVLSLDGFYGAGPMQKGFTMIERGWVELMGTDTHNVLYGQALMNASRNKKIEKVLEHHTFLNSEL